MSWCRQKGIISALRNHVSAGRRRRSGDSLRLRICRREGVCSRAYRSEKWRSYLSRRR